MRRRKLLKDIKRLLPVIKEDPYYRYPLVVNKKTLFIALHCPNSEVENITVKNEDSLTMVEIYTKYFCPEELAQIILNTLLNYSK